MADNFKYEILKCGIDVNSKVRYSSVISSKKFRAEYEDIILQTINEELDKVLKNGEKITNIGLAKAVVDRLFGEGEWITI